MVSRVLNEATVGTGSRLWDLGWKFSLLGLSGPWILTLHPVLRLGLRFRKIEIRLESQGPQYEDPQKIRGHQESEVQNFALTKGAYATAAPRIPRAPGRQAHLGSERDLIPCELWGFEPEARRSKTMCAKAKPQPEPPYPQNPAQPNLSGLRLEYSRHHVKAGSSTMGGAGATCYMHVCMCSCRFC